MTEFSITQVGKLTDDQLRQLTGIYTFTSTIAMGHFIKRLQDIERNYSGDYTKLTVELN